MQDALAERLIARIPMDEDEFESLPDLPIPLLGQVSFLPLAMTPFGDAIGLYGPTAKALFLNSERSIRDKIYSALEDFSDIREIIKKLGYALTNGVIVIHDFESLMEEI